MKEKIKIIKSNGFKVLDSNGAETEHEANSLKRFLEIITLEQEVIEAFRNKQIDIDDESLSLKEIDQITAALESALAEEIFSDVISDDDY